MLKVSYASISEKGTIDGKKGDQTGLEVKTAPYYNFGQTHYTRFRSVKRRKKLIQVARELANNNNIGYSQKTRETLFNECVRVNWDRTRISEIRKCNTDCSMFVSCVVNLTYGKQKLPPYITTYNMFNNIINKLMPIATYKQKKLPKDTNKLRLADIVYKNGHVVIITER